MGLRAFDRVRLNIDVPTTATVLELKVVNVQFENFENVDFVYNIQTDDGTVYEDVKRSALTKLHKVDIEEVLEMQRKRNSINSKRLKDLEFYKEGKRLIVDQKVLDDWRFVGPSNIDFVTFTLDRER